MIDYDRLVYKSTWGTSRKITLDEMDVQEFEDFEGPPRPSRPQADHTYETNEFRTQSPSDPVSRNEFEDSPWFYTHVENSPYSLRMHPPRPKTPVPFRPSKTFIPSKHH
jgi:hypothetical protein